MTYLTAHDRGDYAAEWAVDDSLVYKDRSGRTIIPREACTPRRQSKPNDMSGIVGTGRNPVRREAR